MNPRRLGKWLASMALAVSASAIAQPAAPVRLMVGYAPGGTSDTLARIVAEPLEAELGRTVIVDNRPGANGRLAAEALKNAPPDGGVYLIGPDGWAVFQTLTYPAPVLKYDFLKDFAPVARLVSYPMALVASQQSGAANAREFAAWIKANPSKALFGAPGTGGGVQFAGELLGKAMGTPMTIVPYKGNAPLMTDLIGGQAPSAILVLGDALKFHSDKIKVIGIIADQRWSAAPEIPTLKEQGYDISVGMAWMGMWAPAKTPQADIQRMETALKKVLARPDVRKRLEDSIVVVPDFAGATELDRDFRAALAFWEPVIKQSGFKPD